MQDSQMERMIDTKHCVCFSGHRLHKLADTALAEIQTRLAHVIQEYVQKGFNIFYVGMADGFDMMAAEEVVNVKIKDENIRFIAVIPNHNWREFSEHEKDIFGKADEVIAVAEHAKTKSYHKRNRYMVDNASVLICYYNGAPGGTRYTVEYAAKQGLEVVNMWEDNE